jgi:hypothetical protein
MVEMTGAEVPVSDPLAAYAVTPLLPTETAYRLVAALLDPAVRGLVNGQPRGGLELHWDIPKDSVRVTVHHASRFVLKLHAPTPRNSR